MKDRVLVNSCIRKLDGIWVRGRRKPYGKLLILVIYFFFYQEIREINVIL